MLLPAAEFLSTLARKSVDSTETRRGRVSGIVSLSNSSRLPPSSDAMVLNPVRFPPGLARLSTKPDPTGSLLEKTIGIVLVAFFAARASFVEGAISKSTSRPISSWPG